MECLTISVKGVVQGVGFRPFVYKLAHDLSVKGFVTNTADGVLIAAEGTNLKVFLERLAKEAPPLSKIMSMDITAETCRGFSGFTIRESAQEGSFTLLSPDISVCSDCLREVFDSNNRRYLYPFTNCTNCGPRYSITESVPYDRKNTTMRSFEMCEDCKSEYFDPANRRFHAQPNACPRCGPQLTLILRSGLDRLVTEHEYPMERTITQLKEGKVVALKGLGGFHLACDASHGEAVQKLRERKRKNNKPFALMAPSLDSVRKFCYVTGEEEDILASPARPIVLLRKREDLPLPDSVSPNNGYLAFMLPYTPLHYLLFHCPPVPHRESASPGVAAHFDALVMTSGNLGEEPIVTRNDEAVLKLREIADAFLCHNRGIYSRVDDSVIQLRSAPAVSPVVSFLRRSRGFVPDPIPLDGDGPDVLGCGADVKNTFTLTRGGYAIPSQHIGDMENYETLSFFEESLKNLTSVYRAKPEAIVYDLHPGYRITQWALRQESLNYHGEKVKTYGMQHHYAHIASVMAEYGIREKIIGVAFDGSGYGGDGTLWGGEFLVADISGFRRAGHISYLPLPGGEMAIREPWRTALGALLSASGTQVWDFIKKTPFREKYGEEKVRTILKIAEQKSFSPLSSGAGRVFDAVAALTGICDRNTFEGEAAIALESLVRDDVEEEYPVNIIFRDPMEIDFSVTMLRILDDTAKGVDPGIISSKFHNTVSSAIGAVVLKLSAVTGIKTIAMSGGVFQNSFLVDNVLRRLESQGLHILWNRLVPCNDAGISLGQAYIMRERLKPGIRQRSSFLVPENLSPEHK